MRVWNDLTLKNLVFKYHHHKLHSISLRGRSLFCIFSIKNPSNEWITPCLTYSLKFLSNYCMEKWSFCKNKDSCRVKTIETWWIRPLLMPNLANQEFPLLLWVSLGHISAGYNTCNPSFSTAEIINDLCRLMWSYKQKASNHGPMHFYWQGIPIYSNTHPPSAKHGNKTLYFVISSETMSLCLLRFCIIVMVINYTTHEKRRGKNSFLRNLFFNFQMFYLKRNTLAIISIKHHLFDLF